MTLFFYRILKNRFDTDVSELEIMLKEINAALTNIQKQKTQHNYVKKEKIAIKKALNKIRDDGCSSFRLQGSLEIMIIL